MRKLIKSAPFVAQLIADIEALKVAKVLTKQAKVDAKEASNQRKLDEPKPSKEEKKELNLTFVRAKIRHKLAKAAYKAANKKVSNYLVTKVFKKGKGDKVVKSADLAVGAVSNGGVSDLTVIEGIGPKIREILSHYGIGTFQDLATRSSDSIRDILKSNGLGFTDPSTWAEQAHLASIGKMKELEVLKKELKHGKRVK
jgi:predicted flap endonuclease-1-like 5' DNA nuclease